MTAHRPRLAAAERNSRHWCDGTTEAPANGTDDYRVTQIGDCVVTQRPRARAVMADRQNDTLTQIGK